MHLSCLAAPMIRSKSSEIAPSGFFSSSPRKFFPRLRIASENWRGRLAFGFLENTQNRCEDRKNQKKENKSPFVMEPPRQKARVDINAEQAQGDNPNSVLDDRQRDGQKGKKGFSPGGPQK